MNPVARAPDAAGASQRERAAIAERHAALFAAGNGRVAASVWAVLDGARDPAIHRALADSRLDVRCLYAGRLAPALERAAPQLVELLPQHRLTLRLLGEGFGRSWGIYARIADASALRPQLRRLLRVRTDDGRRLVFRYYDPRVLRLVLPVLDAAQLAQIFGPIDAYFAEADDGAALLEYRFDGHRLALRRHARADAGTTAASADDGDG